MAWLAAFPASFQPSNAASKRAGGTSAPAGPGWSRETSFLAMRAP